jgi:hydrogenase maturation protein HypF
MAIFPMCPTCQAEYEDPLNRRFNAQPNACWECGPQVELWDRFGHPIQSDDPIAEAARQLQKGKVVAVKGLGGFHLAVDATNAAAVALLRERKKRVEKPFAVMVPNAAVVQEICELDDAARKVLESVQRAIVLLPKKSASPFRKKSHPLTATSAFCEPPRRGESVHAAGGRSYLPCFRGEDERRRRCSQQ